MNIEAKMHVEKGLYLQLDTGISIYLSLIHLILAMIHFELSALSEAQTCARSALLSSQQSNEKYYEAPSLIWLGRILNKADPSKFDEARNCIVQGIEICDKLRIQPFSSIGHFMLGELHSIAHQRIKAIGHLKKAGRLFQEMRMGYWLAKTQEILDRL